MIEQLHKYFTALLSILNDVKNDVYMPVLIRDDTYYII